MERKMERQMRKMERKMERQMRKMERKMERQMRKMERQMRNMGSEVIERRYMTETRIGGRDV
jgi:hypothetical protein